MASTATQLAFRSVRFVKVALICPYDLDKPGGVQSHCIDLVARLPIAGVEATLVAPGTIPRPSVHLLGQSTVVRGNRSAVPLSLRLALARELRSAIAGADVVHIHEPLAPLVSWLALKAGKPAVLTFHASPPTWVRRLYRLAAPWLRRLPPIRTAVSEIAAAAIRHLGPVEVIPLAIDPTDYGGAEFKSPDTFTFLGRPDPRKGLDVLLAAWPSVIAAKPAATLNVMGTTGDIRPGVKFHGRVTEDEKRAFLARSSVFCAPNLGGESFGIILLEAMASGCALVCSSLEAFRAVAGEAALYVTPGNPHELAAALLRASEPPLTSTLAEIGHKRVSSFSWEVTLPAYVAAYRAASSLLASE